MEHIHEKIVESGEWPIEDDVSLDSLVIKEGATVTAPEGKEVNLIWFGVGRDVRPGNYKGDVILSVVDEFALQPTGPCMLALPMKHHTGILIQDNELIENCSETSVVQGGTVSASEINDVTIRSTAKGFNGITICGDSECTINRARIYLEGDFGNDMAGWGTGIHCAGTSRVTINDSDIRAIGVIRNTLHAGEHSKVVVNNSTLIGYSMEYEPLNPTWELGIRGDSRVTMVIDFAEVEYNNCYIAGNGWGLISIDGAIQTAVTLKDCKLELLGVRTLGYGGFSTGNTVVTLDHSDMDVQGYAMLVGVSAIYPGVNCSGCVFTNESKIHSNRFGVKVLYTRASSVKLDKGTVMDTGEASFIVMGSQSILDLDHVELHPGNGVIMQLMDNTMTGMGARPYVPHFGKVDVYVEGRDLTMADPEKDIIMNLSNMEVEGDMFNSTTNLDITDPYDLDALEIFPYTEMDIGFTPLEYDMETTIPIPDMTWMRATAEMNPTDPALFFDPTLLGPHNMAVNMKSAKVTGVISAAAASYPEGFTMVDVRNAEQINDVIQTPSEAINNGVIVTMDAASVWTLTGDAYLTSLTLEDGAVLAGKDGKSVKMIVDGAEVPVQAGTYTGKIKLELK